MVALDTTILLPLLSSLAGPPSGSDGKPIDSWKEKIDHLIEDLQKSHEKIIIPTPVLAEVLVHAAHAGAEYLRRLKQSSSFRIEPFDDRAAVEVAIMIREDLQADLGKRGGLQATWAKVKFDRQIVAIAKVNGASVLYSDDPDIRVFGQRAGLTVISTSQLPLPEEKTQMVLFDSPKALEPAKDSDENEDTEE